MYGVSENTVIEIGEFLSLLLSSNSGSKGIRQISTLGDTMICAYTDAVAAVSQG